MIVPILTYNCIVNLNLTRSKANKLTSLDNQAKMILGQDVSPLLNRIHKHAVLFVEKWLTEKVCFSFSKYFNLVNHSRSTRNNGMSLKIPKVKLEFARSGFFFMGVRICYSLPLEIRRTLNTGFRNKVTFHFMN